MDFVIDVGRIAVLAEVDAVEVSDAPPELGVEVRAVVVATDDVGRGGSTVGAVLDRASDVQLQGDAATASRMRTLCRRALAGLLHRRPLAVVPSPVVGAFLHHAGHSRFVDPARDGALRWPAVGAVEQRASDELVVRYWMDPIRFIAPEYEDRPNIDEVGRPKSGR